MNSKNNTSHCERMYTNRLIIEPFQKKHKNIFLKITEDPMVKKYFHSWRLLEDCIEYFDSIIAENSTDENLFLVIYKNDYTPIGLLNAFYKSNDGWIIEYAILKSFRKHGYMTELLQHICKNAVEFLSIFCEDYNELAYLEFEVQPDNTDSIKTLRNVATNLNLPINFNDDIITIQII